MGKGIQARAVSIHAPARGATYCVYSAQAQPMFQSTRPRGARLAMLTPSRIFARFNPRARAGRDNELENRAEGMLVSIHAPARGATLPRVVSPSARGVSIHAPARGAT